MSTNANSSPLDVPSKRSRHVPERTKQAVIAAYAVNGSIIETATKFGIHRHTVRRILLAVRSDTRTGLSSEWRATTRKHAINAVDAGLTCPDDPYKRGALGNQVLIGLGEFKSGPDIKIGVQINECPPELRSRLVTLDDDTDNPNL